MYYVSRYTGTEIWITDTSDGTEERYLYLDFVDKMNSLGKNTKVIGYNPEVTQEPVDVHYNIGTKYVLKDKIAKNFKVVIETLFGSDTGRVAKSSKCVEMGLSEMLQMELTGTKIENFDKYRMSIIKDGDSVCIGRKTSKNFLMNANLKPFETKVVQSEYFAEIEKPLCLMMFDCYTDAKVYCEEHNLCIANDVFSEGGVPIWGLTSSWYDLDTVIVKDDYYIELYHFVQKMLPLFTMLLLEQSGKAGFDNSEPSYFYSPKTDLFYVETAKINYAVQITNRMPSDNLIRLLRNRYDYHSSMCEFGICISEVYVGKTRGSVKTIKLASE